MEIKKIYPESAAADKRLVYKLTRGESTTIQKMAGTEIAPVAWCIRDDTNSKNEEVTILTIMDNSGIVYSTISSTFMREFTAIAELMGEDDYSIMVTSGKTKAGRDFMNCTLI